MKIKQNISITGMLFLSIFLLAACAPELPPEDAVENRAQQRWDALIAFNPNEAWEFYTPGFRSSHPQRSFAQDMSRRPIRWLEAEVTEVLCEEEDLCTAWVEVKYDAPGAPPTMRGVELRRAVEETWLRIDGQWWYAEN